VAHEALQRNVTHITHAFNAQRAFDHRAPGLVGAMLSSDEATVEVIADGVHVHPVALKILVRCVGTDRVVLITDSMAAAGAPDGEYRIGGQLRIVKDGVARLSNGNLAGSVATMNRCVRTMVRDVGVSLADAVKMASLNPARAMGFADRLGALRAGHDASLTVIDDNVNVYLTMVKGQILYSSF
jgi:N-acetylglucosamine-6-phosphate deacetylase